MIGQSTKKLLYYFTLKIRLQILVSAIPLVHGMMSILSWRLTAKSMNSRP